MTKVMSFPLFFFFKTTEIKILVVSYNNKRRNASCLERPPTSIGLYANELVDTTVKEIIHICKFISYNYRVPRLLYVKKSRPLASKLMTSFSVIIKQANINSFTLRVFYYLPALSDTNESKS